MAIREKTKYTGVYVRTSTTRRYQGKPDTCFEFTYKADGKLIWEKVGWKSEGYTAVLASELRAERIRQFRHPELFPNTARTPILTYGQAWKIFSEKRLPFLKSGSQRILKYHYAMHIEPFFANTPLHKITSLELETFRATLMKTTTIHRTDRGKSYTLGRTLAPSTIKSILMDMLNVFRRMIEWGMYSGQVPKISQIPVDNARQRFLTPVEADRLLGVLEILSCRVYRVAVISLHTGMRVGEILRMRGQDLDFEHHLIYIDGKTGRREAFMDETVSNLLRSIVPSRNGDFFFTTNQGAAPHPTSLSKTFTKAVNILGLNDGVTDPRFKVVIHTLRHTFCSWLASQNVPLYTIGKLVGHANLRSTQRYAKLTDDAKWDALKLIEKTAKSIHHTS